MTDRFLARGYSRRTVNEALEKARCRQRTTLLNPNQKQEASDVTRFITEFNNQSRAVRQILKSHWKILGSDTCLGAT